MNELSSDEKDILKEAFLEIQSWVAEKKLTDTGLEFELLVQGYASFQASYQKGGLENFKSSDSLMAGFRLICKGSSGYAYTENLSPVALKKCVEQALLNLETVSGAGSQQESFTLFSPAPIVPMDFLFHEDLEKHSIEEKLKKAEILEKDALAYDPRVSAIAYGGFSHTKSWIRILNSKSLDVFAKFNSMSVSCYPLIKFEGQNKMAGVNFWTRDWNQLDSHKVARRAAQKSLDYLGAKSLASKKYHVLFENSAASNLFSLATDFFSAKEVFQKKSILEGKLNQQIFSEQIEIWDDPFLPEASGSRPFDDEGAPSHRTCLVANGVLKNYLTNYEYAQKMQLPHTCNASRSPSQELEISYSNFVIKKGTQTFEELLQLEEEALLITEVKGLHAGFNSSTGDFSFQSVGFLYQNGKRIHPVEEIVVSGNVLKSFLKVKGLSDRYDHDGSSVLVPDILVSEIDVAGKG
jgi:PmbA protein